MIAFALFAVALAKPQIAFAGPAAAYTAAASAPYPYAGYYGSGYFGAGAYPYYNNFAVSINEFTYNLLDLN